MESYLDHGLPATSTDVVGYASYSVELREPILDSSSVRTYLAGLSAWHEELSSLFKEADLVDSAGFPLQLANPCRSRRVEELLGVLDKRYKKPSCAKDSFTLRQWYRIFHYGFILVRRSGRHHRLLLLFCTFGCLRRGGTKYLRVYFDLAHTDAGVSIRWLAPPDPTSPHVMVVRDEPGLSPFVRGTLDLDKNVDARKPRRFYLPAEVHALGVRPVDLLEDYIVQEGVPSGALLFAAPKGNAGWYAGPYTGHGRAFKQAYARAFPGARDVGRYSSGSARKSLGQWLWTWGWSHRMISDVGGWYTPKVAMDSYFTTHRATVLRALQFLGTVDGVVTEAHWD